MGLLLGGQGLVPVLRNFTVDGRGGTSHEVRPGFGRGDSTGGESMLGMEVGDPGYEQGNIETDTCNAYD